MKPPARLRTVVLDCPDPLALAQFLFGEAWDPARFERASRATGEKTLSLPRPVPIHLVYWTALADEEGVSFFADVYGADQALDAALRTGVYPPRPGGSPARGASAPR